MGNLKFGNETPLALYIGVSGSTKAYYGTTEVYSGGGTDYSKENMTLEIVSGNSIEWIPYFTDQEIYYSINGGEWMTDGRGASISLSVEPGDNIRFKGENERYGASTSNYGHFVSTETYFNIEGNILSMIYGNGFTGQTEFPQSVVDGFQFINLFKATGVLSVENLILPKDVRANCYQSMFRDCTSLTAAPELPATTLANYCYQSMFNGCTSLSYIKCLATYISANSCTSSWVRNVASSGTFVKNANMYDWTFDNNGIPLGWTVIGA